MSKFNVKGIADCPYKKSQVDRLIAKNMAVLPVLASEVNEQITGIYPEELKSVIYSAMSTSEMLRRSGSISMLKWYKQELGEVEAATLLAKLRNRRQHDAAAYEELALEVMDVLGLIVHYARVQDLDWVAPDTEDEYADRETFIALLSCMADDVLIGMNWRLFNHVCSLLTIDLYYKWYDDKLSKGYDMSEAWVYQVALAAAILSLIPTINSLNVKR